MAEGKERVGAGAGGKAVGRGRKKAAPKAIDQLKETAGAMVDRNSAEIVNCLLGNLKKGHFQSAKLLVELASVAGGGSGRAAVEPVPSLARQLRAELMDQGWNKEPVE